jgi:hypothetical protein
MIMSAIKLFCSPVLFASIIASSLAQCAVQVSGPTQISPSPGAATSPNEADSATNRINDRSRKFPLRENQTGVKLAHHVNAQFGGFQRGSGFGFGFELTSADSIPGIEFRASARASVLLYRKFEGEALFAGKGSRH